MKTRKSAYSAAEEQTKIAEVLKAYSVHYHEINFTLFKAGILIFKNYCSFYVSIKIIIRLNIILYEKSSQMDTNATQVRTKPGFSKQKTIESVFSAEVSKSLENFSFEEKDIGVRVESFFTNANYSGKKMEFLLFINNRMVNSKAIR